MIRNYPDQRSQSCKREKNKMLWEKFANYSDLIRSKFSEPNNLVFYSESQKKMNYSDLICKSCDYGKKDAE